LHALPWNIAYFHWIAVIIDIPAKTIAFLDSLSHVRPVEDQETVEPSRSETGDAALARCRARFQVSLMLFIPSLLN
jgi:hypothetical protein